MANLNLSSNIKLVISDFDGIFTDSSIFVDEKMHLSRKLSFKDIMGVSLLMKNGFSFAIVSGEKNTAIEFIKKKFKLKDVYQKIRKKSEIVQELMQKYNLLPSQIAYIGDDVNDIEPLNLVDFKITVPNANKKVKEISNIQITNAEGGNGAFREIVDSLIENIY